MNTQCVHVGEKTKQKTLMAPHRGRDGHNISYLRLSAARLESILLSVMDEFCQAASTSPLIDSLFLSKLEESFQELAAFQRFRQLNEQSRLYNCCL